MTREVTEQNRTYSLEINLVICNTLGNDKQKTKDFSITGVEDFSSLRIFSFHTSE